MLWKITRHIELLCNSIRANHFTTDVLRTTVIRSKYVDWIPTGNRRVVGITGNVEMQYAVVVGLKTVIGVCMLH